MPSDNLSHAGLAYADLATFSTDVDHNPPGALCANTMTTLRAYFNQQNHHPSADHLRALEDVAGTMEDMANDTALPKVYLSAIDPGVGKSTTVIHFARALVASPQHRDVGMLICVGRLDEAEALARTIGIPPDKLAVLTSRDELNALGGTSAADAQVLITTQQRIERATDGRSFADAMAFHYRGRPRQVRVWDEAFLPGVTVTLDRDDLCFLPKLVRPFSPECADALFRFAAGLTDKQDGEAVDVPDFAALYGVSLYDVLASAAGIAGRLRDDQQMAATALVTLNGRTARVRYDGRNGNTLLTYRDTLPDDLAPLLVLDASGRVRQTYKWMEQHRGSLVRLTGATKDYGPLTIQTWQTSGSKSGFERNADTLTKGIADTILTKPTERWLVVVHKPGGKVRDVDKAIRRYLPANIGENVATITWGSHMATNAHADVPNVILAGTLFMRDSFYTALTNMAQDRNVALGLANSAEVAETMKGEHANLVLQAICRGRVRKSNGNRCQPMTAYVIASPRSGIPKDLTTIFPGCSVVPWNPTKKALRGNLKRAVEYVETAFVGGADRLTYGDIRTALNMKADKFREKVTKLADWTNTLADLGLVVTAGARGWKVIQRA